MSDDDFRHQLGQLVRRLLEERERSGEPVAPLLRAHLGEGANELPILTEQLDSWELPNLQLGLDAAVARPGWSARTIGLTGQAKRFLAGRTGCRLRPAWHGPRHGTASRRRAGGRTRR